MPIEIREIIIKTEIRSYDQKRQGLHNGKKIRQLKQELMEECKKMLSDMQRKNNYKR